MNTSLAPTLFGTFYGYEQRTNVSRLFQVYATSQGLYFGWIADRDYEEMLARFAGHNLANMPVAATQQAAHNAETWEQHYATLALGAPFLDAHRDNFHFALPSDGSNATAQVADAASVTWKLKMMERAATRMGALDLVCGGKKRRFYLVGQRTPAQISELLQRALPGLALETAAPASASPSAPSLASNAPVTADVVASNLAPRRPNWPLVWAGYALSWCVAVAVAALFQFWWLVVACMVAPYLYRMIRMGGILRNFYKNTEQQLERDRAKN